MSQKISAFVCGLLLLSLNLHAQITLKGQLIQAETRQPVGGAAVSLAGTFQHQTAANDGTFLFRITKPSTVVINISLIGYKPVSDTLTIAGDTTLTILLEQTAFLQDEVIISGTRAQAGSGLTYTNLSAAQLADADNGKDMPYLLQSTPSLVTTSDAGTGIGYTGVRIRGTDASRINVTLNGIPLNDPESQQLYWVDLPDLASSTDNIQVQRGVGTSTNGAGAFGGSINILSATPPDKPFASSTAGYGSFHTLRNTISAGTGLINNHWNFEGRVSRISSDGYIDRATSNLKSGFFTAGYYGKNDLVKLNLLTGHEVTYQAWNGVPEYVLDTNRTYNAFTYKNQVDNYRQDHYQLFWSHHFNHDLILTLAGHYTYGTGYYEEYKESEELSAYLLDPVIAGTDTITITDLVRRKWLRNDFYGSTITLEFTPTEQLKWIAGGAWNRYDGDHFGKVIWSTYASNGGPDHEYYRNNGLKTDATAYLKSTWSATQKLSVFGDLQVRNVRYQFDGLADDGSVLPQDESLFFFNPKAGMQYAIAPKHQVSLSAGIANKEPSRDDYVDNPQSLQPKAEQLLDLEAGYAFTGTQFSLSLNGYYMHYNDQLAVTGKLNDVGNPVRVNIPNSYRSGIEVQAGYVPSETVRIHALATVSKNKIKTYDETLYNYDDGTVSTITYNNSDLAFSPELTGSLSLGWKFIRSCTATLTGRYVGNQFLDNTSNDARSLDPYLTTDFKLEYQLKPKFMKGISLAVWVNNLFDTLYESNGYTYSYIYGGSLITENFYYPQAGRNFMAQIKLDF